MGYYTKSDASRGPVGTWMRRERLARDWSVPDVSRELAEMGETATPATIRQYEAGPREPGAVLMGALIRLFGSEPDMGPAPETDVDRLAKAIERLADVLERRDS